VATRILIADDDAPVRQLLRRILEEHSGWQVCGEASNGRDALAKTKQLSPDVVVIDLAMPQMNGFDAAREISKSNLLHMPLRTSKRCRRHWREKPEKPGSRARSLKGKGIEGILATEPLLEDGICFASCPDRT
jgi:CheY-like chemotaxis protein